MNIMLSLHSVYRLVCKVAQYGSFLLLAIPVRAAGVGIDISSCGQVKTKIQNVANFGGGIVTTVAIIVFLLAGYYLLFGPTSEDAQKKGKQYLVYGIVGVVVALIAFTLPQLVTSVFVTSLPGC